MSTFWGEVLRSSPVNTTGVQTPDLVGCPQNDNVLLFLEFKSARLGRRPLQMLRVAADEVVQIISLIAGDFGIDFEGPAIDAACEGFGGGDALLAEPVDYVEAAHAVVAVADD